MNRAERRRVEALAERVLAKAPPILHCVPSRDIAIVDESSGVLVVREEDAWHVLGPLGLMSVLDAIRSARGRYDASRLPTVVIVGGRASVAMMETTVMSKGGSC